MEYTLACGEDSENMLRGSSLWCIIYIYLLGKSLLYKIKKLIAT